MVCRKPGKTPSGDLLAQSSLRPFPGAGRGREDETGQEGGWLAMGGRGRGIEGSPFNFCPSPLAPKGPPTRARGKGGEGASGERCRRLQHVDPGGAVFGREPAPSY